MIKIIIFHLTLCLVLHHAAAVIYNLNRKTLLLNNLTVIRSLFENCLLFPGDGTEYVRMPPVYALDDYELCLSEPKPLYCITELALVSDEANPLLELIHEYSEDTTKHYNHTVLYRGVCVSRSCKKFHLDTTADLKLNLEACLNESLYDNYQLKTRIIDVVSCSTGDNNTSSLTTGDIAVAVICIAILLINIVGSLCDFYCTSGKSEHGVGMLINFSIRHNWRKLVAPPGDGPDPRLKRLKIFYFIRSLATTCVITSHSMVSCVIYIANPYFVENMYNNLVILLFANGTVLIQVFFIISGFLLVYNLKLYAEKNEITWKMLPMGIMQRYIRLTPPYAIMIALVCTWFSRFGSGPLWTTSLELEMVDCQRNWWYHLLYIHNYIDGSQCFLHSWYLAADTQLYVLGLLVCVAFKTNKSRKVVLPLLAVAGIAIPAIHTYLQDLNGVVLASPTVASHAFVNDTTYDNLYKRGHTNLFGYTIGLTLGCVVYHLQQTNIDIQKYRKYRLLYWSWPVPMISLILLGGIFYQDGPRHSIIVRMLYASLSKPIFGILFAFAMMGYIFKYENVYRSIGEWPGWTVPGRLSYCAYLVHVTIIKLCLGVQTTLGYSSMMAMMQQSLLITTASFVAAVPLWLLVETPFGQLTKLMLPKKELDKSNTKRIEKQEA